MDHLVPFDTLSGTMFVSDVTTLQYTAHWAAESWHTRNSSLCPTVPEVYLQFLSDSREVNIAPVYTCTDDSDVYTQTCET